MINNIVPVCTVEEVREEFRRRGISVSDWARRQGVSAQLTYRILAGRTMGLRGQSHEICVLLGLKPGVIGSVPDGHPKLLHCWPVKLLQAGRGDYAGSEVMIRRAAASLSL